MPRKIARGSRYVCTLLIVILTAHISSTAAEDSAVHHLAKLPDEEKWEDLDEDTSSRYLWRRDLEVQDDGGSDEKDGSDNCSFIDRELVDEFYNSSTCDFVLENCQGKYDLFNYLGFAVCDLKQVFGFIFLTIWLLYLLLLLSTTLLANKLRLPPSVAGMTLLALGNGAPDIFVAFSALQDDDLNLMLGALLGAGLFITSVVLGTVLQVTPSKTYNINPINFMRDLVTYILVLVLIIVVAYDGKVTLAEAICFPLLYIIYVAVVVGITYFRKWITKDKPPNTAPQTHGKVEYNKSKEGEEEVIIGHSNPNSPIIGGAGGGGGEKQQSIESEEGENGMRRNILLPQEKKKKIDLVALTIPKGKIRKVVFILEWPFSFLRWLTIPPCCHDGKWSVFHFCFAVFSPIPMSLFLLLTFADGWSGYTGKVGDSSLPVPILVLLCVSPLCVVLFFTLSWKKPPHWIMQVVLMICAFIMSVAWLNFIANEVVDVLQALGLLVGVSTAILGLTVLAIGNSMADWVSDTIVTLKGKPEMALASCFGAPLITHVFGLTLAILPKIIANGGASYTYDIVDIGFVHVKMSWIFLGIVLLGSAVVFPIFKFNPPREYSLVLIYVYAVFMIFSILIETGIFDVKLL